MIVSPDVVVIIIVLGSFGVCTAAVLIATCIHYARKSRRPPLIQRQMTVQVIFNRSQQSVDDKPPAYSSLYFVANDPVIPSATPPDYESVNCNPHSF